ncbi:hypothetical protein YC2023_113242 [Brassica napus]
MATSIESSDVEVGFAKLQGEDFEYYMQTYSIVLGRNSKKSTVDYPGSGPGKRGGRGRDYFEEDDDDDNVRRSGKNSRREGYGGSAPASVERKGEGRTRADREADDQQVLQLEEKDVVSSVANVLSDSCGPGEYMAMEKLHSVILENYGNIWHHSRVRRYLTPENWAVPEAKGKAWYGLLMLLRKYPEHFVINTRSKGRVTHEFVSLVSLLS